MTHLRRLTTTIRPVGDGTSTSTILAHAIFADGLRNVVAEASTIDIERGLALEPEMAT
jgi:chaperonin GroEL